jgi:hypothetical protein
VNILQQAIDEAKLEALRAATGAGTAALDQGAFKEFADAPALIAHLDTIADAALGDAEGPR